MYSGGKAGAFLETGVTQSLVLMGWRTERHMDHDSNSQRIQRSGYFPHVNDGDLKIKFFCSYFFRDGVCSHTALKMYLSSLFGVLEL